ncbi:hypothetical protein GM658_08135 [Pseudoduganella eburnea]|uniref:Carboxypeptidase regulatory-like domain-containing protein n=1 Tax=Massilia eburnea TaxID=1776165 RepID=A0A6L6QDY6_9BURK|nr:hypothetical protein [Massilia eburnea]MTW10572.1 hypothetical protein [Massilia eburnea]
MKLNKLILASAVSMALAACGGGGSATSSTPPVTQASIVFSGSAAVGAPLAGAVTVKDAKGVAKTVQIGANGDYSVDVTGMTGPFVFRAAGMANGQSYTVHSVANSADAAGKINITQLTDLVAGNVGGQAAKDYFDQFEKNSNAANATATAINAEVAKLKEKLQPVLTALGVDANTDLLRTPFTPLTSPLDKALDAIHVTVDPATAVATISTTANTSVITDDLKQKAAAETAPATLTADNIATATTDAPLVKQALTDFIALFANGAPTVTALLPLATTGFLNDDMNATAFFSFLVKEANLVGATFTDIEVHKIDYSDPTKITAVVSFTVKSKDGTVLERLENWKVRKTDGGWRIHGNQRAIELELFAEMNKIVTATGTCYRTGLNINITERSTLNTTTSGTIDHVLVTGPGLPQAGLRYNKASESVRWESATGAGTNYVMSSDCAGAVSALGDDGVAGIPDNAAYVVTAYDASNNKLSFASGTSDGTYTLKIQKRPLTLTETKASTAFPAFSDQTVAAFNNYTGGTLAITGSNLNPAVAAWTKLITVTSIYGVHEDGVTVLPSSTGAFSTSLLTAPLQPNEVVKTRTLFIESPDIYHRNMQTVHYR